MDRYWSKLEIYLDYGYDGPYPPACLSCYSDGSLIFRIAGRTLAPIPEAQLEDRRHSISQKSLQRLDELVEEILQIEKIEGDDLMDGPSFACHIHLAGGRVTGFHYVSMALEAPYAQLEKNLRKILREEFFLRKHAKTLTELAGMVFPI